MQIADVRMPVRTDPGVTGDSAGAAGPFDAWLLTAQSTHVAAVAASSGGGDGRRGTHPGRSESARAARIAEQTEEARVQEMNADHTRRADPTSVEHGVISARHERVVQESAAAVGEAQSKAALTAQSVTVPRDVPAEFQALGADVGPQGGATGKLGAERPPAPSTLGLKAVADTAGTSATAQSAVSSGVQTEGAAGAAPGVGVGMALPDLAGAGRSGSAEGGGSAADPARLLGRLLSRPTGGESAKSGGTSVPAVLDGRSPTAQRSSAGSAEGKPAEGKPAAGSTGRSTAPEAPEQSRFGQLVRALRMQPGPKSSTATIQLHPPELGRIRIDMRMVDDVLRVRVETSTEKARELLTERAADLTSALRAHDIRVERFEFASADARSMHGSAGDGQAQSGGSGGEGAWGSGSDGSSGGEADPGDAGLDGEGATASGADVWSKYRGVNILV